MINTTNMSEVELSTLAVNAKKFVLATQVISDFEMLRQIEQASSTGIEPLALVPTPEYDDYSWKAISRLISEG